MSDHSGMPEWSSTTEEDGYDEERARPGRWLREQRGLMPEVALDLSGHVAGIVTVNEGWIKEVAIGGRRLSAHLVVSYR